MATTFDPSHKTHCTLSGGNLTALHSGGGNTDLNAFSVDTTTASQKVYGECNCVQLTYGGQVGFSADNTSSSRNDSFPSTSAGCLVASSGILLDQDSLDHTSSFIPSWTAGDNIDIAFDVGNNKMWFRKNNGAWNASHAGSQDPATNQGGARVVAGSGPFYFFIGSDAVDGDGFTATFASASWARTAPSGFTELAAAASGATVNLFTGLIGGRLIGGLIE